MISRSASSFNETWPELKYQGRHGQLECQPHEVGGKDTQQRQLATSARMTEYLLPSRKGPRIVLFTSVRNHPKTGRMFLSFAGLSFLTALLYSYLVNQVEVMLIDCHCSLGRHFRRASLFRYCVQERSDREGLGRIPFSGGPLSSGR